MAAVRVLDLDELPHEEPAHLSEGPDQGDNEGVVEERPQVLEDHLVAFANGPFEPLPRVREVPLAHQSRDQGSLHRDEERDVEVHEEEEQERAVVGVPGQVGPAHFRHVEIRPRLHVYVRARCHEHDEADHGGHDDHELHQTEHERYEEDEDSSDGGAENLHAREVEVYLLEAEQNLYQGPDRDQPTAQNHRLEEELPVRGAVGGPAVTAFLFFDLRNSGLRFPNRGRTCSPPQRIQES